MCVNMPYILAIIGDKNTQILCLNFIFIPFLFAFYGTRGKLDFMASNTSNSGQEDNTSPPPFFRDPIQSPTSPFFIHPSESPSFIIVTTSLSRDNYQSWSRSTRMILISKNKMNCKSKEYLL